MSIKLEIFLLLLCIFLGLLLLSKIIKGKIEFRNCLPWFISDIALILITIFNKELLIVKDFLGFEVLSNMIFLFGFVILSLLVITLLTKISDQNKKIIKLNQELSILRREFNDKKNLGK